MENKLEWNYLIYERGKKKKDRTYDFQKFKTVRPLRRENHNNDLSLDHALER